MTSRRPTNRRRLLAPATACALVWWSTGTGWAAPRVDLTLAVAGDAPVDIQQRWYKLLTESKTVSVRLRKQQPGDQPSQTAEGDAVRVTGVVDTRGRLFVPGQRFEPSDRQRVRQWLVDLTAEPAEPPAQSETQRRRAAALGQLAQPVEFATKGRPRWEVAQQIVRELALPVEFDATVASRTRGHDEPDLTADEFKGIAAGTALAALLRPAGLGLRGGNDGGGGPRFTVAAVGNGKGVWPVGEPVSEGAKNVLPGLFEFFSAELDDVPLERVVTSVAARLKAPLLWDWRALELAGVNLPEVRVSFPPRRTAYMMLLREVLLRAELRYELRTDDAGQPLLWITTKKSLDMLEADAKRRSAKAASPSGPKSE